MPCPAALHLKCTFPLARESIIRFGVVCVYKCGSNEVVSPVTALAALRGSLIYHSSAATSILFIASVEGLIYTGG